MYEKILQKLKEQRQKVKDERGSTNVSDRTLEDLAKSMESVITTDEILAAADLSTAIKSIDGNIDHYTAQQVDEVKKTFKPEQKKPEVPTGKKPESNEQNPNADPVITQLLEQQKAILEQLNGFKSEKVTQTRSEVLQEKLKDTPAIFKNATLSGFSRAKFESEEEFNAYLGEVEKSAKEAIQIAKESGLNNYVPKSEIKTPDPDEVTPEMQKAIEKVTKKEEITGKF